MLPRPPHQSLGAGDVGRGRRTHPTPDTLNERVGQPGLRLDVIRSKLQSPFVEWDRLSISGA